jgi:hypothetical protein
MSNKAFRLYARLFESAIIVNRITYLQDIDNFSDGIMSLIAKDGVYYLSSNSPDEDQNRHIQFGALHPWHPHHPKRSSMLL